MGGTIDEKIQEHFKLCAVELPKKFPTWFWIAGILLAVALGITASTTITVNSNRDSREIANKAIAENVVEAKEIAKLDMRVTNLEEISKNVVETKIAVLAMRAMMERRYGTTGKW